MRVDAQQKAAHRTHDAHDAIFEEARVDVVDAFNAAIVVDNKRDRVLARR